MKTLILPGFSLKNKDWAEEIKKSIDSVSPTTVHYWKHWDVGETEPQWVEKEIQRICANTPEKVNVIAKSIGTLVAVVILKSKPNIFNKIILCGIPIRDLHEGNEEYYSVLKGVPAEKFICFQNENDNHGTYQEVEKLLHSINSKLEVVSKPRSDHEYPYPEEFTDFLTQTHRTG